MTKRYWILIGICISLWVVLLPVVVLAETSTYTELEPGNCYVISRMQSVQKYVTAQVNKKVRMVMWKNNASTTGRYDGMAFVSTEPFGFNSTEYRGVDSSCVFDPNKSYTSTTNTTTVNGVTYYVVSFNGNYIDGLDWNVVYNDSGQSHPWNIGIYYTYGAGAVDPVEPINWGLLRNVEYNTRIAGNGHAALRNIDYLTWDNVVDSNGNDISECEVMIRAVYGKFRANDLPGLWDMDYQDLVISDYALLAELPATQGMFSISWGAVIDGLNGWDLDMLYAHNMDEYIEKNGWYYQIALVDPDGVVGQWQTMYTPLVSSPSASEVVLTQNSYNNSIYQVYQSLTLINNQVSISVDFDGTTYQVQNPNDGEEPAEPIDYWDILKEIRNGIIQVVGNIQKIPERIAKKAEELITPQLTDGEELKENITQEYEEYMQEEQPTLWGMMEDIEYIKQYVYGLAPQDMGAHICILKWDAVTMDLTPFNAGSVTFIAAGEYNLTVAFVNLLHAYGLSYADYEFYTGSIIYLWMAVFIFRHWVGFLNRS